MWAYKLLLRIFICHFSILIVVKNNDVWGRSWHKSIWVILSVLDDLQSSSNTDVFWFFIFSFSAPNDKKAFCSVEGEWNGVMYAKYATGVKHLI